MNKTHVFLAGGKQNQKSQGKSKTLPGLKKSLIAGYAKPYDFVDRITNIQNLNDVDESACDVADSALGEGIDLTNNAKVSIQFLKNLLL